VQANLMANERVWPAMARAYRAANGDLAERMLQALEAAQKEGGDIRGQQSAAMVIVRGTASDRHGRTASSTCASTIRRTRSRSCADW
jgi:uncharacterized Ntn-hydrolase superfamily protein